MKKVEFGKKSILALAGAGVILLGAIGGIVFLPKLLNKTEALHINLEAELDCTDAAAEALDDITGDTYNYDGEVIAHFYMSMNDGAYTFNLDTEQFKEDLDVFFEDNIDGILTEQVGAAVGATDADSLNAYAQSVGYADWNAVVDATAASVMGGEDYTELADGEISYEGEYVQEGVSITYTSGSETVFTAEVENGLVYVEYNPDRSSPQMFYDYFNRGVSLEFHKASEEDSGDSDKGDDKDSDINSSPENGVVVNVYIETVPATEETTAETTVETTPAPTETTPAPTETLPGETLPGETLPGETAPAEEAPTETAAEEAPAEG